MSIREERHTRAQWFMRFFNFFNDRKKVDFFLVVQEVLPPPSHSGPTTKKKTFFYQDIYYFNYFRSCYPRQRAQDSPTFQFSPVKAGRHNNLDYLMNHYISEFSLKKIFNQDEGKIECAVGNRELCFWQGKNWIFLVLK